jgi:SRSO17 transposase
MLTLTVYGGTSMDIPQIRKLNPALKTFLKRFDDCFPRKDTRAHLPVYISGQLSDLPETSVEPIALNAGVPPRTLREFLSRHRWDQDRLRDKFQEVVRDEHAGPHSIGIFDETSDVKKGDKTPGVQRQWRGAVGKKVKSRFFQWFSPYSSFLWRCCIKGFGGPVNFGILG